MAKSKILVKVEGRKYHKVYPFWKKFLTELKTKSNGAEGRSN